MDTRYAIGIWKMKALMVADVLCAYPDNNKPFHIYNNALKTNLVHVLCWEIVQ